jgi:L-alanine-DL-glutamate epimerase-like enolase superfamily enzyme
MTRARSVTFASEAWKFKQPLRITGHTFDTARLLHVKITEDGRSGHGEGAGVYYLEETVESMMAQAELVRGELEEGAGPAELRTLLPAGGARNAIDCALWDLEAKRAGTSIWELSGIEPGRTRTAMTVGIGTPAEMATVARALDTTTIKVKLDGSLPLERMSAVREARPDAEIIVDVNQGWSLRQLEELAPKFGELGVAMIEQPLARGSDAALENYRSPVPLCADESCLGIGEFDQAARRYQMINIKLDKTGGLTEALVLAAVARSSGIELMVGSMMGTSLAMAPAFVVAQLCRFVDLDGALFLERDREPRMTYTHGEVSPPSRELWG